MDFEIEGDDDAYNFDMWKKPSKSKNFFSGGDEDAVYNYDFRGDVADPIYALDSPVVSKKKTEAVKSKPQPHVGKSTNNANDILDKAKSLMSKYSSNPVRASAPSKPSTFDDFDEDDISVESSGSLPKTLTRTSGKNMKEKQIHHKTSKGSYNFDDSPAPVHMASGMQLEDDDISEASLPKESSVYSIDRSQLSGNDTYSNDDFENGEDSVLSDSAVVEHAHHHHQHHHKPSHAPSVPVRDVAVNDEPEKLNLHTIADLLGDAGWDPSEDVHQSFIEDSIPDISPPAPQPQVKYSASRESSAVSENAADASSQHTQSAQAASTARSFRDSPVASPVSRSEPAVQAVEEAYRSAQVVEQPAREAPMRKETLQPASSHSGLAPPPTMTRQVSPPIVAPKPSESINYPAAAAAAVPPPTKQQQSKEFVQQFQNAVQEETLKYSQQSAPPPPSQQQPIYSAAPQPDYQAVPPSSQPSVPPSYPPPPYFSAPQPQYYAATQQPYMPPQVPYGPPPYTHLPSYAPYPYYPMAQSYPPPPFPYPYPNYMDLARSMPTHPQRSDPSIEYEKKIEALMSELTFAKEEAAFATRKLADVIMNLHQHEAKSTVSTSTDDIPKPVHEKKTLTRTSSSNSFDEYEDDFEESHVAPSMTSPPKSSRTEKLTEKHEKPKIHIPVDDIPRRISSESPRFHLTSSSRSSEYMPRRSVRYDLDSHRDSASALLFTSQEIFRRQLDTLRTKLDVMNASRQELRSVYRPTSTIRSVSTIDDLKKNFEYRRKTTQAKLKDALLQADPTLSIQELNNLLAKYG